LSWESRCEIVTRIEAGVSPRLAAASGGASRATAYRLWRRYQAGGWAALRDRPSTPHRQPRRLPAEAEQLILAARRCSAYGPVRLAGVVPYPPSTIGKVLRRYGCSRLPRPGGEVARCARRYERELPGELLHVDTKRLGRFWEPGKRVLGADSGRPHRNRRVGWQHLHVAIDDHSRLAYAELLPGQDADSCVRFLERAVAWYRDQGVITERVLSDNAKAYHSRAWIDATQRLAIARRYTRVYRPRTNGKAERLIQTLLREWAYARSYPSSDNRARALAGYLRWYNRHRPHSALGAQPPISRVSHLCGHDS
jgi:transposase InsO family protein